jgi:hypothetical protein
MTVVLERDQSGRYASVKIRCDSCPRSVRSNALSEDELRTAVSWIKADVADVCPDCQRRRGMKVRYLARIEERAARPEFRWRFH